MGSAVRGLELPITNMGWRVPCVVVLLCASSSSRPSLLGAAGGEDGHHGDHGHHGAHDVPQAVDYSDYDYQPSGRDLGAEDEYYEDTPIGRAYSFQFEGDDLSRTEQQDDEGLVTGSYSYLGADGVEHVVNYRAGAGIGFEIIDPEVSQMFSDFGQKMSPVAVAKAPAAVVKVAQPEHVYEAPAQQLDTLYGAPAEDLPAYVEAPAEELPSYAEEEVEATTTGMMMDPSYYFQYKSADSERVEDADSTGAVVGSYSYTSPGGQQIMVRYRAGADTGFVIENQEELDSALLKASSEPFVAKVAEPKAVAAETKEHVFTLEEEDVLPTPLSGAPAPLESLYSAPPSVAQNIDEYGAPAAPPLAIIDVAPLDTLYGAPAEDLPSYVEAPLAELPVYEEEVVAPMMVMDPSYNFGYSGEAGSREEAADSQGIVTGQYSYLSPEGNEILVRYHAGADTGFVIDNEEELAASVRAATDAGAEAAAARAVAEVVPAPSAGTEDSVVITAPEDLYGAPPPAITVPDTLYGAPSQDLPSYEEVPEAAPAPAMVMDASFNFAIDADHTFQEEADMSGERTGSYSYQSPDGSQVTVRYTAGRDGFVILNPEEVYPRAP